jgi:hypothetical protein
MAILKKVVIPAANLPLTNADNTYVFKYRIKSTDGSKSSEWSQIYIKYPNILTTSYKLSLASDGSTITGQISLDKVTPNPSYDIFIKWSYDNASTFTSYAYFSTLEKIDSFSVVTPKNGSNVLATHVQVLVQAPTTAHTYLNDANYTLIESVSTSTAASIANFPSSIDGGVLT